MKQPITSFSDKHRVFLFDFDGTLFDSAGLKVEIAEKLKQYTDNSELLWETERQLRGRKFHLVETMRVFCEQIGMETSEFSIQNILLYHNFPDFVFPEAISTLEKLHNDNILAIFSEGDEIYQQFKIHQSRLSQSVDFTYIFPKKQNHLAEIVKFFGQKKIWYVDNQLYQLQLAHQQFSDITTVWINRENLQPNVDFHPTHTITSLEQL